MMHHRLCQLLIVSVGNVLVQDAVIAGFLDVSSGGEDHPKRIIREIAADGIVALLGKRLILMEATAVFKLGCCKV